MTEAIEAPQHQFSPSPSDKLKVYLSPPMLPACCWLCSGDPDGKKMFYDIGMQQDYYGAVYICSDCLMPLVHALNYVSLEEYEGLQVALISSQEENKALRIENTNVRDALNSLSVLRPDLDFDSSNPSENLLSLLSDSGPDDQSSGNDEQGIDESDSSGGSENSPEPANESRGLNL